MKLSDNVLAMVICCAMPNLIFAQQWYGYQPTAGFDINAVAIPQQGRIAIGGGRESHDSVQIMFLSTDYGQTWNENEHDGLAQWNKSIAFSDPANGFGVGNDGRIIKTDDGGAHWGFSVYPVNRDWNKIVNVNASTYFAAGGNRVNDSIQSIIKTTDGGANWSVMLDQPGPWLKSIFFTDTLKGFAIGDSGVILSTINGGSNWSPIVPPIQRDFNGITFINADTGFIVGGNINHRTILSTNNGGANWSVVMDTIAGLLTDISFADSLVGYTVGDSSTVLKTIDGGTNWTQIVIDTNLNANRQIRSVKFINSGFGAVGGEGGLLYVFRLPLPRYILNTDQATYVTYTSATLNGSIDSASVPMNLFFEYDTTPAFSHVVSVQASPALVSDTLLHQVSAPVSALQPFTNYYYRLKAVNGVDTYYGNTTQFYTSVQNVTGSFITETATEVTDTVATLNGTINGFYYPIPVQVSFQFGTTDSFGREIPVGSVIVTDTLPHAVSVLITGLSPDTSVYFYRLVVNTGSNFYYGNIRQLFTGTSEVPNWDFKNWHTDNTLLPAGWYFSSDYFARVPGHSGNYALQITGPTIAAKGGPMSPVVGGSPFQARPDSMIAFLKYNIEAGDSGLIWLHLAGAGQTIADAQYFITGSSGGIFKRMSIPISYNSSSMPDTIAVVFASSNPLTRTDTSYLLSSMTIDDISFSGTSANFPNHDLESWNNYTVERPDGWKWLSYFVDSSEFNSMPMVSKILLNTPGDYALQIQNIVLGGQLIEGAMATFENLFKEGPDFPIARKYYALDGYFEYLPENGDSMKMEVRLKKGRYGQELAYGEFRFRNTVNAFTRFDIPLLYMYPDTNHIVPDWASISFGNASNHDAPVHGHTRLILDKLTFDASVPMTATINGIHESNAGQAANGIKVYPNPASDLMTIELNEAPADKAIVQLYDLNGHLSREINLAAGQVMASFTIADLQAGFYLLHYVSGSMAMNQKIAVVK